MLRKEIRYSKHEYDRIKNGNHRDYERGRGRGRDSLEHRGVVREKIVKDREVINGVYRSSSSRTDTAGGSGGPRRCEFAVSITNGIDGVVKSEPQEVKKVEVKLENGNQTSPLQNKKRKFSPIIWDKENREAKRTVKRRTTSETVDKPLPSPPVDHQSLITNHTPAANGQASKSGESEVHTSEASLSKLDVLPDLPAETSSRLLHSEDEPQINTDDNVPTQRITSSRWSNSADSPADEGEISDYEDTFKLKRESSFESEEARGRISVSPEPGEIQSEGSRGTRGRSSRSNERDRSSSRDSIANHDRNGSMRIDDDQSDDASTGGDSNSEAEDYCGSHGTPESADPPQRTANMRQGCRSVDEFEWLNKIDEGTYGIVSRARDKKTGKIVALKKVKMEKEREGFPLTALREMNILLSCHHPYIVDVKEVVVGSSLDEIYMVMEYMEHDLKALMETMKQPFSQSEVKCLMLQLLEGIKYLHGNWVLHRDLKTSNLLLNNCGELKICDFGMARQYGSPLKPYTQLVVTLWYRAPELLLGAKQYSTAVDMWSLGCIMAELLSKETLFNGKTELDQLDKIFKVLGTPNETIWPGCSKLPGHKVNFVKHKYNLLRRKFPAKSFIGAPVLSDAGFDLLSRLLTYDPDKRITAEAALNHAWFREVPLPKSKEFMPTFPAQHEQDRVTRRVLRSPDPLEEQRRKELQQGDLGSAGLFGL